MKQREIIGKLKIFIEKEIEYNERYFKYLMPEVTITYKIILNKINELENEEKNIIRRRQK